jgi:hypothetical protein
MNVVSTSSLRCPSESFTTSADATSEAGNSKLSSGRKRNNSSEAGPP